MSLDLRPKTLLLSNLPAELQSENGLREHLQVRKCVSGQWLILSYVVLPHSSFLLIHPI